jgi:hypothetical protein
MVNPIIQVPLIDGYGFSIWTRLSARTKNLKNSDSEGEVQKCSIK